MKKKTKVLLTALLFIIVFLGSAFIRILLLGSAPTRLMQVEWNESVGTILEDLDYTNKNGHQYDLYIPADLIPSESQNLILYIHGGSFNSGSKEDGDTWCKYYSSRGYITATLDYTLQGNGIPADLNMMNEEIGSCVEAIYTECNRLGYDIKSMAVAGVSAGGTLAMNYAYKSGNESTIPVAFIFQLAAPTDFEPAYWGLLKRVNGINTDMEFLNWMTGEDISEAMIESGEYESYVDSISPARLVNDDAVPILLGYGLIDHSVPENQKYLLMNALDEYGIPYDYIPFPNSNHGMYNDLDKLQEFLDITLEYCERYFE